MVYRLSLLLVGLVIFLPGTSAKPDKLPPQRNDKNVTVVAIPKFYVSGAFSTFFHHPSRDVELELFGKPDPDCMHEVDGFILEVIHPPEYAGRIIGLHHDWAPSFWRPL